MLEAQDVACLKGSRWLLRDVPKKMGRVFPDALVTHMVAEAEPAHA